MPDQPPFDPEDETESPPTASSEGVRLIKPDEAAEAVERGEAVKRRGGDRPKYGDRPEAPDGPRPDLRFPLADSADPTLIVRPKVAPVDRPTADDPSAQADQPDDQAEQPDQPDDEAEQPDQAEQDEPVESVGRSADERPAPSALPADEPAEPRAEPTIVAPLIDSPVVRPAPGRREKPAEAEPIPFPAGAEAADAGDSDEPLLSLPISESTELPHWTEPATGEVPKVLIGELDDEDEDARWSSFADQGPRWRDQASGEWDPDDTGVAHLIADPEEPEVPLGALDTSERLSDEEFLNFDDLDVPQQELPTARPRGSYDDPISIQSEPARPARPTAPGTPRPAPTPARTPAPSRRPARRAAPGSTSGAPTDGTPPRPPSPSGGSGRDVPTAALVGVAIATFALILFHLGPKFALALVFVVVVLAGAEFFTAVRRGGFRPATLLGLAAIGALPLACYWRGESAIPLVLFLITAFSALWFILGLGPNATANIGVTVLGTVYVGVFGSYAALMLKIPTQGVSILLVTVIAAVLYDVGGFFIGRRFGHTPLSAVSPHKTMEGLAGGMLATVVGTVIVAGFIEVGGFSVGQAIVFGVFCAFAAPLGDLAESVIKRDLGLKDMGSILPEHGGLLDRFDALLFVLPTGYYVVRALHLAGL
ncbi:MAG: phosphatidate cytidylyltransferase [Acidimicrobiales bacterium]